MSNPNVTTRSRNPAVAGRVNYLKDSQPSVKRATTEAIYSAIAEAAEKIAVAVENHEGYDVGRLIAAQDKLDEARNTACTAIYLGK